jgi:hypothetical protein
LNSLASAVKGFTVDKKEPRSLRPGANSRYTSAYFLQATVRLVVGFRTDVL